MTSLTSIILKAKEEEQKIKTASDAIMLYVYDYLKKKTILNEDQRSDFLLFFNRRIHFIIRNFCYRDKPFEHYLNVHIKFQTLTFLKKKRATYFQNVVCSNRGYTSEIFGLPFYVEEETNSYAEPLNIPNKINNQRKLIFILRNYMLFEHDEIVQTCSKIGYDKTTICNWLDQIRCNTEKRQIRRQKISERKNMIFSKLYQYQEWLNITHCELEKKEYRKKIKLYQNRLIRLREQEASVMIAPTHSLLSRITGIPKGTIDSSMHYIRSLLAKSKSGK